MISSPTPHAPPQHRCRKRLRIDLSFLFAAAFLALLPQLPACDRCGSATAPEPDLAKLHIGPAPDGVTDLAFRDFFRIPVGAYGLEMTDTLKALDGKKVRVVGFMVKEDLHACSSCVPDGAKMTPAQLARQATVPGRIMLTPHRSTVAKWHFGLSDDLPPQTVFITIPEMQGKIIKYRPEPLLLIGTLSVGNQAEEDGRISVVRLVLDTASSATLSPASALSQAAPGAPTITQPNIK